MPQTCTFVRGDGNRLLSTSIRYWRRDSALSHSCLYKSDALKVLELTPEEISAYVNRGITKAVLKGLIGARLCSQA